MLVYVPESLDFDEVIARLFPCFEPGSLAPFGQAVMFDLKGEQQPFYYTIEDEDDTGEMSDEPISY